MRQGRNQLRYTNYSNGTKDRALHWLFPFLYSSQEKVEALEAINKYMNEKLEAIRRKCIEANPEINDGEECKYCFDVSERPIRLSDVLLAIKEVRTSPPEIRPMVEIIAHWNLRKDDLNEQSQETVNFLADLLR